MSKQITTKRILTVLGLLASLVWLTVYSFPDNKLHVIFCNVGQGDATLISKGFNQILIDGGPNDKVLDCLAKNMPFYDRTIEIVALTHPEADHMTGLISVLEKYKVQYFLSGPEGSETAGYAKLISTINVGASRRYVGTPGLCKGRPCTAGSPLMKIINPYSGTKIKLGDIVMESVWPSKEWVAENIDPIADAGVGNNILGAHATEVHLNDFSLVFLLTYDNNVETRLIASLQKNNNIKRILFMGDADIRVQDDFINSTSTPIDILKFPHHGSKTGMSVAFLEKINPKEAVISVGKNSFGHPTSEALDMLRELNVRVRRTDIEGDVKYVF